MLLSEREFHDGDAGTPQLAITPKVAIQPFLTWEAWQIEAGTAEYLLQAGAKEPAPRSDQQPSLEAILQECFDAAERSGNTEQAGFYACRLLEESAIAFWPPEVPHVAQADDRNETRAAIGQDVGENHRPDMPKGAVRTCGPVTLAPPEDWEWEMLHSEPLL
jgi:hypothetical protein